MGFPEDQTRHLSSLERILFKTVQKIVFQPLHLFMTLDDDLFGTRATENQVKNLSSRKADRQGHVADVVFDEPRCLVLTDTGDTIPPYGRKPIRWC